MVIGFRGDGALPIASDDDGIIEDSIEDATDISEDIADESIIEDDVEEAVLEAVEEEVILDDAEDSAADDIDAEDEDDWASAPVAIRATIAAPVTKYFIVGSPFCPLEGLAAERRGGFPVPENIRRMG